MGGGVGVAAPAGAIAMVVAALGGDTLACAGDAPVGAAVAGGAVATGAVVAPAPGVMVAPAPGVVVVGRDGGIVGVVVAMPITVTTAWVAPGEGDAPATGVAPGEGDAPAMPVA